MNEINKLEAELKEKDIFITNILEEMKGVYNELCSAKQSTETLKYEILKFLDEVKSNG